MEKSKRAPIHDWRKHLKPMERKEVDRLEAIVDQASRKAKDARAALGPIKNRAIQRSRYATVAK